MTTDWLKIISAHVAWKQRLQQMLAGQSTEQLDPGTIALDNRCDLGKWIYGSGKNFEGLADFVTVRGLHAQFHLSAAAIVSRHRAGDTKAALELLNGDYSRTSDSLKRHILKLRTQVE